MNRKWLITGASGLLGHNACAYFVARENDVTGLSHGHDIDVAGVKDIKVDLMDFDKTGAIIREIRPDVILHCAAVTNVDACESDVEGTQRYHVDLSRYIAEVALSIGAKMIMISTDQLWDGSREFMDEECATSPLNVYGRTKADGEKAVMQAAPDAMIIRTNFFGIGRPWRKSFSDWLDAELSQGHMLNGFTDIFYTPIAIPDFLVALEKLVDKDFSGIIHLAGSERVSKYAFMKRYAQMAGYDESLIQAQTSAKGDLKAKRPMDMSLSVKKIEGLLGYAMPTIAESIAHVLDNKHELQQRKVS